MANVVTLDASDTDRVVPSRRWLGLAQFALGLAGLVIGVGVGARWLWAGAVAWQSVLGIAALALGLVSTWLGISALTRRASGWVRAISVSALVVLALVTVWTLAPALVATVVPPIEHGPVVPSDVGLEARGVRYTTEDGVSSWAWYVPARNGRAVVLRHGSGSTSSDVLSHGAVLASHGYGVLMTDARGHGRSGGTAMDFGWLGTPDIEAAVTFLEARPEVGPGGVAVVGLSMGGEEAIGAAAEDTRIVAVVAEGVSARSEEDKVWMEDVYGWRGWAQLRLEWLQYSVTDLLTPASRPIPLREAVAAIAPRPVLLITGGSLPDEGHAARFVESGGRGNVTIWDVEGAGHTQGLATSPIEWEEKVVGLLDSAFAAVGQPDR